MLDLGVNVMVMQVTCKAPGCVPLETAIIIVFPPSTTPLLPGLDDSAGGSYKTKILKPMAQVTKQDVLEALPPAFVGGLRSPEKLALATRDVMLAQITQLFGDDDLEGRTIMAQYLQQSLQDYIDRDCTPPEWGQPFPDLIIMKSDDDLPSSESTTTATTTVLPSEEESKSAPTIILPGSGNLVIRRPRDDDCRAGVVVPPSLSTGATIFRSYTTSSGSAGAASASSTSTRPSSSSISSSNNSSSLVNSVSRRRLQHVATQRLNNSASAAASSNATLNQLVEREHAPGIRKPGCPCCDPDNPRNVVDKMMRL
jgi:hypothetical protein